MNFMDLFRFLLIFLVPGLIGAVAFSIAARFKTEINIFVALILDLLAFIAVIVGLSIFKGYHDMNQLFLYFVYTSFVWKFVLHSIIAAIILGVIFGLIRRLFFWIRR